MSRISQRVVHTTLFLSVLCALANTVRAQEGYRVDYVHFSGNETFSGDQLRTQVTLDGYNWIQEHLLRQSSSEFHSDILASDINRLRRYYQRRGFLKVRITRGHFETNAERHTMGINLDIEEGPPVIVDTITLAIVAPTIADSVLIDSLYGRMKPLPQLAPGMRFRDNIILADADSTDRYFADHGFPYASTAYQLTVDSAKNTVAVMWTITSGPRCYFGDIDLTGHRHVSDALIEEQLECVTGDLFRQSVLDQSQRQLIELGVFEIATVTGVLDKEQTSQVPVRVTTREAPQLSAKLGAGYGREDNFRVFTDSRILRFLGGARRLELYAKHSGLEPYHVRLRLTQPSFPTQRTSAWISPFMRRQHEPGFILRRYGVGLGLDHRVTRRLTLSGEYSFEHVVLDTTTVAGVRTGISGLTDLYDKSSITLSSTYDNSRPAFSPNHGNFVALTTKLSGLDLGSDYHFLRTTVDIRHYEGLWGIVVATRLRVGGIRSFDSDRFIPVEDRYFAGGSNSLRGWARGEVGPQEDRTPAGGSSLIESSIELRYPIWGILSGAMFMDAGNVWAQSYFYKINDLRYSAGAGIRVATPIGPVRLDLARPVFDDDIAYELHVSVGQAF